MNLTKNVIDTAVDLKGRLAELGFDLTDSDVVSFAVMIEGHRLFAEANVLRTPVPAPAALEAIAMALRDVAAIQTTG